MHTNGDYRHESSLIINKNDSRNVVRIQQVSNEAMDRIALISGANQSTCANLKTTNQDH